MSSHTTPQPRDNEQVGNLQKNEFTFQRSQGEDSSAFVPEQVHKSRTTTQVGVKAWFQVLGGFLVFFNIWGFPISYGAYQTYYNNHLLPTSTPSSISWIGTIQGFLLITIGVIGGPLYDLGYYRILLYSGSFLGVFGVMMLSLCREYWQVFLAQGVTMGTGFGLVYVPSLALIGEAFGEEDGKRGVAMGVVTSGVGLGGVVYTIKFQQLTPSIGFAWTQRSMGFVSLLTHLIAIPCLLGRSTFPRRLRTPFTDGPLTNRTSITQHQANHNTGAENRHRRALLDPSAFKDIPFLLFTLSSFLIFLGYLTPLFYIPTYSSLVLNTDTSFSLWLLVISQATSLLGRLFFAYVAKFIGVMAVWLVSVTASGILCIGWVGTTTVGGFGAFCGLYGFFSSGIVALPPAIFPLVHKRGNRPDTAWLGTRLGMSWTATGLAFLIGTPIGAAIADLQDENFSGIQGWSAGMLLGGAVSLLLLWSVLVRRDTSLEKKVWI